MMKPLASAVLTAALVLTGAASARAQTAAIPADAGERLEAFLINPDSSGRSFVSSDADRAALGAAARAWAAKEDPGRLSPLLVCVSDPAGESRLRAALSAWTGASQIRRDGGAGAAAAFLKDAADKAGLVLADPGSRREIEASIAANDASAVSVPGARAATERARLVRVRAGKGNPAVFGPDRAVQDLNAGEGRSGSFAADGRSAGTSADSVRNLPHGVRGKVAPAAQLPRSQGRPDGIVVPAPGAGATATSTNGGQSGAGGQGGAPNDGRVVEAKPMSAWERVKDSVKHPLSDAYGFTFEGPEPQPVSFRDHVPALAYVKKAKPGAFTKVTLYGHGAPGMMTVGPWSGDAGEIAHRFKGKMARGSTLDIKGCNTSSIGGASVNPGRGISGLTRRVLYFSIPYLSEGRDPGMRETLENEWDSDLARDTSRGLPGVKVCGLRTFGLVGDRVPLVGSLMGRREATNSDAILGTKACFIDGKEVKE